MIDFSDLPLSPNQSRAARNFLGLSQAQTATQSTLPAHKLKRFETGNYVPDGRFIEELREFYESQGFDFHDEASPGAKAKSRGDVFPAGVVGETDSSPVKTSGSTVGKLIRPQTANLQFIRITPGLDSDQVDRVFDCIEDNEAAIQGDLGQKISVTFLSETPSESSKAAAVAMLRRLAENGLLYARLMGRDLLPVPAGDTTQSLKTLGDLLGRAMQDLQMAVIDGNKSAVERRKARSQPEEVLQALVG